MGLVKDFIEETGKTAFDIVLENEDGVYGYTLEYVHWLEKKVNNLDIPVVSVNEADISKAQQKENIVAIMQADEKDGIYQSELTLCLVCEKEEATLGIGHTKTACPTCWNKMID